MLYRFGVFDFDAATGELRRQGRAMRIEPQPARALALLLARAGELVTRDELRGHLWGGDTHVEVDRGLAYCIGQVRAALGDAADNPRFVETVPRRGFRFVAPVHRADRDPTPAAAIAGSPASEPAAAPSAPPGARRLWPVAALGLLVTFAVAWAGWGTLATRRPVVAVAVFDNETGRGTLDRLAATAADTMVAELTALGPDALGVVGNIPVLREPRARRSPDRIARESGAQFLVIGQVQDDPAGIRMLAHLIRLDDGTHLWVTRVVRPEDNYADLQETVAAHLAEAVRRHVIAGASDAPRSTP